VGSLPGTDFFSGISPEMLDFAAEMVDFSPEMLDFRGFSWILGMWT
jgi:hypothetical protein